MVIEEEELKYKLKNYFEPLTYLLLLQSLGGRIGPKSHGKLKIVSKSDVTSIVRSMNRLLRGSPVASSRDQTV